MRSYGNGEEGQRQRGQPGSGGAAPHKHTHTRRHLRADKTQAGLLHSRPFNPPYIHGAFGAFINSQGWLCQSAGVGAVDVRACQCRCRWVHFDRRSTGGAEPRVKTTALGKKGTAPSIFCCTANKTEHDKRNQTYTQQRSQREITTQAEE